MAEKRGLDTWAAASGHSQQSDGKLLETGYLSDAEIICDNRHWKVHKIILCTRSVWFKKALEGPFKARTLSEGQTGKVTITDFKPADIDCFINFVYTGVISLKKSYPGLPPLVALMEIWEVADFFCSDSLHNLVIHASKEYSREMAQVFCSPSNFRSKDYETSTVFDKKFSPAVVALYEYEDEKLKKDFVPIILGLTVASVHCLSQVKGFEKLLRKVPLFAADWAIAFAKGFGTSYAPPGGLQDAKKKALDKCNKCNKARTGGFTVDTFKLILRSEAYILCPECYEAPDLKDWKLNN